MDELIVGLTLLVMLAGLLTRRVSPTVGVVGALVALYIADVIDASQTLSGFASSAPATVAALYIVAGAVERSGALQPLTRLVLGERSPRAGLGMLAGTAFALSAFVANTPIVAMFIGPVSRWSERKGLSPSRFLMPLSFAAILGGMVTLIGTSTNLVAADLIVAAGLEPVGLFEPARIGIPVAGICLAVLVLAGPKLLPDRTTVDNRLVDRAFTVSMSVEPGGPLDGATISQAGLRQLGAVFLVGVERNGEVTAPVAPEHQIRGGDVLTFAGQVGHVVELEKMPGLQLVEGRQLLKLDDGEHAWFEAVVGPGSPLVGNTLKGAGFRSRYQAAVVALHRSGAGLDGTLGEIRVRVGDSLLLVADSDFAARYRNRTDFLLIQRRSEPPPSASVHAKRSVLILALVCVLALTGVVDVLKASIIGAGLTVATGALAPRQARDAVDLNVVVLIGAAIGIGTAAESSGLASRLAALLLDTFGSLGVWGAALGLIVATIVMTELITNAGAVSLMIPIAVATGQSLDADPRVFALGVMLAASASFLTPIGYQTNTMVYGPGRYRYSDYARLGLPMTAVVVVVVPVMMAEGLTLF